MRLLIDGYNLMHAAGRMKRRFGPDGLRRARLQFLNELAIRLGPERAASTTIVFDASTLPLNQAPESVHKGMTVIYAITDEDADTRIEDLIARDSAPRSLTVVSSDRRIQRAAKRRRARPQSADEFLDDLETLRGRPVRRQAVPVVAERDREQEERLRGEPLTPEQVAAWVLEFEEPIRTIERASGPAPSPEPWTDADLEQIVREVDAEFRDYLRRGS